MKYYYGVMDKFIENNGTQVTAKQLASIIKRDVEYGKWNIFKGGEKDKPAECSYTNGNYTYHEHLFISGKTQEFTELQQLIGNFIKVIPRKI